MNLPPTNALIALETLDRVGSISATADILGLTHSAVSHKIKHLEQRLRFKLTQPNGRGVILSSQARQYIASIRPALLAIEAAQRTISTATGVLTVNIATGFAANWLAPRVKIFQDLFPDIELRLKTAKGYGDFGDHTDDIYISFARESEVTDAAIRLFSVDFFPVCSPALIQTGTGVPNLSAPEKYPLLHLNTRRDWAQWLRAAKLPEEFATLGPLYDDIQIMQATAISGHGLFLGDSLIAAYSLQRGLLVKPFSQHVRSDRSYFILPGKPGLSAAAKAFQDWIVGSIVN